MIRAHARPGRGLAVHGHRSVAAPAAPVERPASVATTPDRLALEVVRHLNHGDLDGFRRVVAPTVRLAAPSGVAASVGAAELFGRLTTLAPRQTLCAARILPTPAGARVDLEVAWTSAPGEGCASSLGTLELTVAGGRVTALSLDLDGDPAVERAARALAARNLGVRRAAAR